MLTKESDGVQSNAVGIVGTPTLMEIIKLHGSTPYYLDFYRLLHIEDVIMMTKDVPGSIVECGTGAGFTLAMFYLLSKAIGKKRQLWSYDSFKGLPEPRMEDLTSLRSLAKKSDLQFGGMQVVIDKLHAIGIGEDEIGRDVKLVGGWFKDTLPSYDGPPIAIVHADADLYDSTKCILENFWPKMMIGGVVIFDEYDNTTEWPGEKHATDEFFAKFPKNVKLCRDRFGIRYHAIKIG